MLIFGWIYAAPLALGVLMTIIGVPLMCATLVLAGFFAFRTLSRFGPAEGWRRIADAAGQRFEFRSALTAKVAAGTSSILLVWLLVVAYLRSRGVLVG